MRDYLTRLQKSVNDTSLVVRLARRGDVSADLALRCFIRMQQ